MILRLAAVVCMVAGTAVADAAPPLPFDVGGPFALTDQDGAPRSQADPDGRLQLLFFGYANCEEICSAALPMMGDVADLLTAKGADVRPVMITVDPERDTPAEMGAILREIHPEFVGLTGTPEELQVAYDAYNVEVEHLFTDPAGGKIFAHGSFVYLLDGAGEVLTLLPPILSQEQAAEIVETYARPAG